MSVCSDPCSIAPDERGVLRARIAGDPDVMDWPYPCTLDNSDLNRDDDCLWATPAIRNSVTAVVGEQFPNVTLASGVPVVLTDLANLTIDNPDPCREAYALVFVTMEWTLDGDFDPDITFGEFTLSRQITGDGLPAEGAMVETYRNHIGTRTTAVVRVRTTVVVLGIPPGGSAQVGLDMQAQRNTGSMIWSRARGWITAMLTSG